MRSRLLRRVNILLRISKLVDLRQIVTVKMSVFVDDGRRNDGALRARHLLSILIAGLRVLGVQDLREVVVRL